MRTTILTATALVALTAATAAMPVASALPLDGPLIQTGCTYPQIEAALRAEAPQAADRLAADPGARNRLQELLSVPVEQRRERIQDFLDRNPDVARIADERRASPVGQGMMQRMARVAQTCPNY